MPSFRRLYADIFIDDWVIFRYTADFDDMRVVSLP